MRTPQPCPLLRLGLIGLCLTVPYLHGAGAKPAPGAKPAEDKPYVLFLGTDLSVQRDKKYYRVENVEGSEFRIKIGKKEFFVPTRNRRTGLKVSHSLKLADTSVKIDGLYAGPAYTPANDPVRKMIAASGAAGGAAAVQDLAYGRMIAAEISLGAANLAVSNTPEGSASRPMVVAAQQGAQAEYNAGAMQASAANDAMLSQQYDTAAYVHKMNLELDEGNHDAFEVSFKVSSPVELDNPHMVILFKFRERDAKPGTEGMLIHAEAIDRIGSNPKHIRVRQGGMPQGFKYLGCEVHIFNRGKEVATNKSSKRVELSRSEAQQYLVIEHIGANKGKTAPALVVPGTLPRERLKELTLDQMNRTYYARIAPDGSLLDLFADESCSLKIDDAAARAVVAEAFFKPALVKGQPVEGVARVRVGEI
ncbi:hypothetical protein ESB00_18685 [Oleiharenicola lentus]|uniref:Uncharacterized protein n=1 Tax=Oleiharenicola lentus TaxID=2508720 RepID=A0A4Q1C5J3_9BACT|nr:hypothetical protein [Oleiharenicola lentus]RXK53714.1 hypothetical protein ESB00_18685 [Oleiharenicola lentus]